MDQLYVNGRKTLCTDKCPCNVDSGIFSSELWYEMVTDTMGAAKLDQCPFDSSVMNTVQKDKFSPFLQILETDFECSGMCSDQPYYMFSDVRNGVPKNGNCKHEIIQAVNNHSVVYAVLLLILGTIGFVGVLMAFSICYL